MVKGDLCIAMGPYTSDSSFKTNFKVMGNK